MMIQFQHQLHVMPVSHSQQQIIFHYFLIVKSIMNYYVLNLQGGWIFYLSWYY